ncbi:hypothetical protein ACTJI8_12710 [Microbacterium sp. 22303]|uniref:hypothetical protein n=1 Tax=Microbacterium sp. 22303 TaxID=3453905 RepID=UPI003F82A3E4
MGTSQREASAAADHFLLKVARENPLQTLTPKELQLDSTPVTIYPQPIRAKAWVRFAAIPYETDCWIHRTTATAAGISFTIRDKTFRCWVWGNAVTVSEAPAEALSPGVGRSA